MKFFVRAAALAITVGAFACTVTSTNSGTPSGSSPTGATSAQLDQCHGGCDKMKFFNCSSAAELSKCYSDCDSAQPKAIDVFIACAQNSICDPECRTNITPPPSSGSSGSSGGSTGGGGVSASSCQTACTKIITTCSLAPVGQMQACVDACTKSGYQYQIDCVTNNQCGDIASRCGGSVSGGSSGGTSTSGGTTSGGTSGTTSGGTSGTTSGGTSTSGGPGDTNLLRCQSDCDFLLTRSCISAAEQSTCRNACTTVNAARDTFMGCAEASADCTAAHDCFSVYTQ